MSSSEHRRTVLVVSPAEERLGDWSRAIADDRTDVLTCAGPSAQCPLMTGGDRCLLVGRADAAVYDLERTRPELLAALMRAHPGVEIVLARDRWVRGQHRPSVAVRRRPRSLSFENIA
jgi:hypothetical protein